MNEPILELFAVSAVFFIIYVFISLALGIEEEDKIVLDKIKAKFST
jgi:hypothetical protein